MILSSSRENVNPSVDAIFINCSGLLQLLALSCIPGFDSISFIKAVNAL